MSKFKNSGYQFVRANPEAQMYQPSLEFDLPRKVDLRTQMTPIENQGHLQSCTANAIAGAYEYLIKKHTGENVDMSRLFIYYNARWRSGEQNEDAGSVIQYGMESLQKFGACNEKTWPYVPSAVLQKPKKPSYVEAEKFRVLDMQQVPVKLDHWKHCLAEGYPIVFGCALFESFDDCDNNGGVVPMPNPQDVARGEHGRHAMLCVGYSDVDKVFIVRNSWGADWGDKGYCYMPYNYLMSQKLNGGDCWMLRGADNLPRPDETWISDNRPLLRGVDLSKINLFPVTAYDLIEYIFFGRDEDYDYAEAISTDYISFYESIESEITYIEEYDSYTSFESEEEEYSEEEDETREDDEEDSAEENDDEDAADGSDGEDEDEDELEEEEDEEAGEEDEEEEEEGGDEEEDEDDEEDGGEDDDESEEDDSDEEDDEDEADDGDDGEEDDSGDDDSDDDE